ncbi:hypothetical protein SDC9_45387 [bioreactor metagenome]|uniref:DUF5723 domain-containing protein n=1 Tax=bioreactor metagenome TaxID=1076179 RepID=A0A644W621_9ZZZZ
MKLRYILLCIIPILFFNNPVFSQEMWGIVNSNYAGINSTMINPAGMVDSKYWLDINLITLDAFAENNSLYIPHEELYFLEILSPAADYGDDSPVLKDTYDKQRNLNTNFNTRLELPSVMFANGDQAFGFQMSVRGAGSSRGIEYHTSKFIYEGIDFDPQQNKFLELRNMKTSALSWGEIALSYSKAFTTFSSKYMAIGITVKKTLGLGGMYFNVPYADYIVYNDSTLSVEEMDAEYAVSMPLDYSNDEYSSDNGLTLGGGWAMDLGFIYEKKRDGNGFMRVRQLCAQRWSSYKYKLGISILDFGYVKFRDNAFVYSYDNAQTYWPGFNYFDPQSIDGFTTEFNFHFAHSPAADDREFTIGLPTAVSLQYDLHPPGYWFFNTSFVYPTPVFRHSVIRPTQLSFTPRYEKRRFELSIPLSLYEWSRLRAGIAVRIWNVTIGTDYFSSWTGWFDFYGSDIYFSWKMSFAKGNCKHQESHFHKGKRYYKNACPDF